MNEPIQVDPARRELLTPTLEDRLREDAQRVAGRPSPGFRSRLLVSLRARARQRESGLGRTRVGGWPAAVVLAVLLASIGLGWFRWTGRSPEPIREVAAVSSGAAGARTPDRELTHGLASLVPWKEAASPLRGLAELDLEPEHSLELESAELLSDMARAAHGLASGIPTLLRRPFGG